MQNFLRIPPSNFNFVNFTFPHATLKAVTISTYSHSILVPLLPFNTPLSPPKTKKPKTRTKFLGPGDDPPLSASIMPRMAGRTPLLGYLYKNKLIGSVFKSIILARPPFHKVKEFLDLIGSTSQQIGKN